MDSAETIIKKMKDAIKTRSLGIFSWPDDSLSNEEWSYYVHAGWVNDWNQTNRAVPAEEFILGWLTVENVNKATKKLEEWKGGL